MREQEAFLVGSMIVALGAFLLWPGASAAAPAPPRRVPPPPPRPPRQTLPPPPPPPPGDRAPAGQPPPVSSVPPLAREEVVIEMPPEIIERQPAPASNVVEVETDEARALGRVIRSEAGTQTIAERVAIAWVARNRARRKKTTIARLTCTPCGKQGKGRPLSTRLPPRAEDLKIARQVLAAARSEDPTSGADAAFEPVLQDKLHAAGRPGYSKSATDVRRDWTRSRDYYGNAGRWELYGPKRPA